MKTLSLFVAVMVCGSMTACKTKQANTCNTNMGAPAVVYKTKADYSKYVPVTLSADKAGIVAYPGLTDIYYKAKLAYPSVLKNGYLLDNRGIGVNTAFLKLSYEDYAKLNTVPPLAELYNFILDKDPFTEIYTLGDRSRFKDEVADINKIIAKGGLKKFTKLK